MAEIVRFDVGEDSCVLVETADDTFGMEQVARGEDGVVQASRRLEDALTSVRDAARASLEVLRHLSPDEIEVEFGIKLAAEAGAFIAKTSGEGHFTVKMTWSPHGGGQSGDSDGP